MRTPAASRRRSVRSQRPALSPAEARAWRRRWALVNAAEIAELRSTPMAVKLRQLASLMAAARLFPRTAAEKAETAAVRARWNRLRRMSDA